MWDPSKLSDDTAADMSSLQTQRIATHPVLQRTSKFAGRSALKDGARELNQGKRNVGIGEGDSWDGLWETKAGVFPRKVREEVLL